MEDKPFMRPVRMPPSIGGALWLGPMPGRLRPLDRDLAELDAQGVTHVLSLPPLPEIRQKSPEFAARIDTMDNPAIIRLEIADFGTPDDFVAFNRKIAEAAGILRQGGSMFVHCAAGIGRTGTAAMSILLHLGMGENEAERLILEAGSGPETEAQKRLVSRIAERIARKRGTDA